MAVMSISLHLKLVWGSTTIFVTSWHMSFIFPNVDDGFLQDRVLNLQCRVNPDTGSVSLSIHQEEENPEMVQP